MSSGRTDVELTSDEVLHHEPSFIVVNKPAGLPSQATRCPGRDHIVAALERYLRRHGHQGRPMLHHRLDAQTSGVMIVALRKEANDGLARAFRERQSKKVYQALVARPSSNVLELPSEIRNHLRRERVRGRHRSVIVSSGGQLAHTCLRVLAAGPRVLELEARPLTGRMHQIRAHLEIVDHPVLGDPIYGKDALRRAPRVERLMLHAAHLELPHPLSGRPVHFDAPPPADYRETRNRWIQH